MHGFRENKTPEQILTFRNQVLFSHHSFSSIWEHIYEDITWAIVEDIDFFLPLRLNNKIVM